MAAKTKVAPSPPVSELIRIPGAEPSARLDAWWWLLVGVIVIIVTLILTKPDPFLRILLFVRDGILVTVATTVIGFLLILVVGLVGGLGRLSTNPVIFGISSLYVELVRGVPLMVQLIWWYFAFPSVLQSLGASLHLTALQEYRANPIAMAIVGLTICYGAYMSEIYRAGIQSIPKGQLEAARSLGMTYAQGMRHVILPQAVRVILPPVGNEFIALLKDSSLVSVVAVADLTRRGREFMSTTFIPIQTWTMVALLYLVLTLFSARMFAWVERRTKFER
jgi:polar amino acid transport system permease protein